MWRALLENSTGGRGLYEQNKDRVDNRHNGITQ
jgi:hypothetical protein